MDTFWNGGIVTVTAPADTFKLTTVGNVRSDLSLTDTTVTDDLIDRLIGQCSRSIAQHCQREFALQGYRYSLRLSTLPPDWGFRCGWSHAGWTQSPVYPPVMLFPAPLVSVDAIAVDGDTLMSGTDFEADLTNGFIYRLGGSGSDFRTQWTGGELTFDFHAGYTLPEQKSPSGGANKLLDLVPDVEDAAIRMVKSRLLAIDRDPYLRSEDVQGVGSRQYWIATGAEAGNMPPDVQDILEQYRIIRFA